MLVRWLMRCVRHPEDSPVASRSLLATPVFAVLFERSMVSNSRAPKIAEITRL